MSSSRPMTPCDPQAAPVAVTAARGQGSVGGIDHYWPGYWFSAGVPAAVS
ncbi:hypothetical protein [Halomonas sp. M4R1S46]|nr:hypothetical protein [Halomonas sp. M4R1S46]UYG08201.1 hypothetical protein OCT48_02335 [Halomonas sp. M4R1S46]